MKRYRVIYRLWPGGQETDAITVRAHDREHLYIKWQETCEPEGWGEIVSATELPPR